MSTWLKLILVSSIDMIITTSLKLITAKKLFKNFLRFQTFFKNSTAKPVTECMFHSKAQPWGEMSYIFPKLAKGILVRNPATNFMWQEHSTFCRIRFRNDDSTFKKNSQTRKHTHAHARTHIELFLKMITNGDLII